MSQPDEQRIRAVYEAALTRPPGERASYVARVAGADTELRERVEALLSGQVDTVLPGYEPGGEASEQLLVAGTPIGSYRIEGPLGAGGMGVVYFATDTKLNRPAAIKLLPQDLADPEARRRFQREAQLVSSLNHPHIVTVYDAGEYQGRQYLITEFVDGGTLRQWASKPRSWQASVELLIGVADGIAVAHEAGILHRDIKPENILLAKNGYAKLADFGIAKLLESDPLAEDSALPRAGEQSSHVGTLAYMSPEQLQGQPLDARSDVYSFGLVLHELLAGKRMFADGTDLSAPRSLPPLPADVPAELRTIVGKALEAEPANRYQTMRDLVVDLRRLVRRSDVELGKAPLWRRSLGYAAAIIAVIAVALLVREYMRDASQILLPAPRNAIAVLPFTTENGGPDDVQLTEYLGDGVRDRLMALPDLSVVARSSSLSFEGQNTDLRTIARTLGTGRLVRGSVRRRGEMLDVRVEILDDKGFAVQPSLLFSRPATQLVALQQDIARRVGAYFVPEFDITAADPTAQTEQAGRLVLFGVRREREVKDELSVDEQKMQEAIDYYRRAIQADPMSLAAHSHLAAALLYLGKFDASREPIKAMVALAEAPNSQATPADLSDAYYTFALYLSRARADGIDKALENALRFNPSNADAQEAYAQWLMVHHVDAGNVQKADGHFREAIRLDPRSLGRYADYAEYLGTFRAEVASLQALAQTVEKLFPDARGYLKLARMYELTGALDAGIAFGLKGYRLLKADGERAAPQLVRDTRGQLAELYARIGMFDEASGFEPEPGIGQLFFRQDYDRLIRVAEEYVIDHPEELEAIGLLTLAYNVEGDFVTARDYLERLGFGPTYSPTEEQGANVATPFIAYAEALKALGADLGTLTDLLRDQLDNMRRGDEKAVALGGAWGGSAVLACELALLDRYPEALDRLDVVYRAKGLAWSPYIEDRFCFRPLANEPRYLALVKHLKDRQAELRQRLPATLKEYGVADVRP
jgi:serine/threonine protein kinase/tetratricopeptide (TPR) repeat protein